MDFIKKEITSDNFEHSKKLFILGLESYQKELYEEAEHFFFLSLKLLPDRLSTLTNLSAVLIKLKKLEKANEVITKGINLYPTNEVFYLNQGLLFELNQEWQNSLVSFNQAIKIKPDYAEAYYNRGNALQELKHLEKALLSYAQAISIKPDYAEAYNNRGNTLQELKRLEEALVSYGKAISIKPDYAEAYYNRGNSLQELKRLEEALASYGKAISIKPDYIDAHYNLGTVFRELKRFDEAVACYDKVLHIKPDYKFAIGLLQHVKMLTCNCGNFDNQKDLILQKIDSNEIVIPPFVLVGLADTPTTHRSCSEIYIKENFPQNSTLGVIPKYIKKNKIRLGYYSADFRTHAVAILIAELIEVHNKEQFELIAFSFGPDVKDEMQTRLSKSFDQFIDVGNKSDQAVAELSRQLGIDIAIDLGGLTGDCRTGIFSFRAAPIQVNYLGYPGTMGANYIDYIIADHTLIPATSHKFYSEKVIYLPNTYQVNDRKKVISDKEFNRTELGLPEDGFIFCCFNNNYKILPTTFDGWIRILKAVDSSVLWILQDNDWVENNLREEVQKRGVKESRLIFGKRMPLSEHLARHRQADLFLDTFPYNAHTTASDALWAGLPVLTMMGESFASRVAASLLKAIDLPELITSSQDQYETLAIELASNPNKLKAIRDKLERNRLTTPLFDTPSFTKHIEIAYTRMYERYHADLPPDHIYIEDEVKSKLARS
jgi:predicted O-linked N-acetylglucosamine transferase (SPINDLY family)